MQTTSNINVTALRTPQINFPQEREVVETNVGLAGVISGKWFKWWPEMKCFSRGGVQAEVTWWKADDGNLRMIRPAPVVKIGNRVYTGCSWQRKDMIYFDDKPIGIIKLALGCRPGVTICIANSARHAGRAPQWCVDEHLRIANQQLRSKPAARQVA